MKELEGWQGSSWFLGVLIAVMLLGMAYSSSLSAAANPPGKVYTASDVKITGSQRRAAEAFYRGKSIDWISYTRPGSSTDIMLRLMIKYLPKYIPGHPKMASVKYMRGGGGRLSANYLYNRSSRDGLVMGQISGGTHRNQIFGKKGVRYDIFKFSWIANYLPQNFQVIYTRKVFGADNAES